MTPRRFLPKTAADYAAIAVAPALIFLMISALANFLTLILYHGGFGDRLSWTLLMYTMGTVGIARIAIEQDRAYSLGYAGVLGIVAYVALLGLVGSPIFGFFILVVIGYLSDVIVRDCTLIDEDVDASGEGLIDSGRLFVRKRIREGDQPQAPDAQGRDTSAAKPATEKKVHQPGRSVMYLSLAALPMFGLGQFFLRQDEATWQRAQWLLAVYLFSGLSLLVTTSFLGLRRYLRQRSVEMPQDVSIGWLAGGLVMIGAVLMIAYLAPLPGRVIAASNPPQWLSTPDGTEASQWGWGDEGADTNPDQVDPRSGEKPTQGEPPRAGSEGEDSPPGDVASGDRQDGPAGNQSGGKQGSTESEGPQSESSQSESSQSQGSQSQGSQSQGSQSQGSQSDGSQSDGSQSDGSQSDGSQSDGSQTSDSQGESSQESASPESESRSGDGPESSGAESPPPNRSDPSESQDDSSSSRSETEAEAREPTEASEPRQAEQPKGTSPTEPSSSPSTSVAEMANSLVSMIKLLFGLVLAAIILGFLWLHRHWILAWLQQLLWRDEPSEETAEKEVAQEERVPPRPFASFTNPIGRENDPRRVVVITFQAFDAWMRERDLPRHKDETPAEFLQRVRPLASDLPPAAFEIVEAYNRVVYGRGRAGKQDVQSASQVWQAMSTAG